MFSEVMHQQNVAVSAYTMQQLANVSNELSTFYWVSLISHGYQVTPLTNYICSWMRTSYLTLTTQRYTESWTCQLSVTPMVVKTSLTFLSSGEGCHMKMPPGNYSRMLTLPKWSCSTSSGNHQRMWRYIVKKRRWGVFNGCLMENRHVVEIL